MKNIQAHFENKCCNDVIIKRDKKSIAQTKTQPKIFNTIIRVPDARIWYNLM